MQVDSAVVADGCQVVSRGREDGRQAEYECYREKYNTRFIRGRTGLLAAGVAAVSAYGFLAWDARNFLSSAIERRDWRIGVNSEDALSY